MSIEACHEVVLPGADKTQATALAIEFWTSQGFAVHTSSYNCLVFRRNGYGSVGGMLGNLLNQITSEDDGVPYEQAATQLTVLCQVLPREAKYNLKFEVSQINEITPGDFSEVALPWCHEFLSFCRQWMKHADDSMPELQ